MCMCRTIHNLDSTNNEYCILIVFINIETFNYLYVGFRSKPLMTTRPIFSFGNNESDVQIASESEILLKWVRPRKVLRYKGIQIVSFKTKEDLMYKCISCNLVNKNPSQVAMHSVQVHKKQPQTYRCSHCYYSCEKVSDMQTVIVVCFVSG